MFAIVQRSFETLDGFRQTDKKLKTRGNLQNICSSTMAKQRRADEMNLFVEFTDNGSIMAQLELPEDSQYVQSEDFIRDPSAEIEKDVAAQVIIASKPGGHGEPCNDKYLYVVHLANLMTGPSVSKSQNRHFRGLATSLLANMLEWIKQERPQWLLDGERANETLVAIEAKNQRNTVNRTIGRQKSSLSDAEKEARYLADLRDQRALERYYKRIGFKEDDRFVDEMNTGTKGFSAKLGDLIKSLRQEVPEGVIKR